MPVDLNDVLRLRLHNLRLASAQMEQPQHVVEWLGAMQAQEFGPAMWRVGQRTTGHLETDVGAAVRDGRILRTHALRPTWHFVARDDIRWILTATATRVHQLNAYMYRSLELDDDVRAQSLRVIAELLADGLHRTRTELADELEQAGIPAAGQRLAYIVMHAELEQLICSGAPRGKQQTYALIDERAPNATVLSHDDALAELTRRYFRSHGPATIKDLVAWASLTVAQVKRGPEMVGSELISETIEGRTYWFADPGTDVPACAAPTVHLLQLYDELFMGYRESRDLVNLTAITANPSRFPLWHAIVIDGQVVGSWQRTVKSSEVTIQVGLHRTLNSSEDATLQKAASQHARFLGMPLSLDTQTRSS